jgi:hypothetical protein
VLPGSDLFRSFVGEGLPQSAQIDHDIELGAGRQLLSEGELVALVEIRHARAEGACGALDRFP